MDDDDNTRVPPRLGVSDAQVQKEQETKLAFRAAVKNEEPNKKPINDNSGGGRKPPGAGLNFKPRGLGAGHGRAAAPPMPPNDDEARKARIDALHKKMNAEKNLTPPDKPRSLLKDVANKAFRGKITERGGR